MKKKVSKRQLLKMIDELEKQPHDRVRILGDVGITAVGAGLGWAAAGTVASLAGATTAPAAAASIAGWLGLSIAATTPIGWVLGATAAGGALAFAVSRLIRDGSMSEGRKCELREAYSAQLRDVLAKERAGSITESDRIRFITNLREVVSQSVLPAEKALELIEHVEAGRIEISEAVRHINALLE